MHRQPHRLTDILIISGLNRSRCDMRSFAPFWPLTGQSSHVVDGLGVFTVAGGEPHCAEGLGAVREGRRGSSVPLDHRGSDRARVLLVGGDGIGAFRMREG